MASKKLSRIKQLATEQSAFLNRCGISTCKDVLTKSLVDLMNINYSHTQSLELLKVVSRVVSPIPVTAFQLMKKHKFLTTSLSKLDDVLHGGLPAGTITEIAGPPGCGKTQFCIMMSAVTALQSGSNVVYIDTENAFTAKRFLEIVKIKVGPVNHDQIALDIASKVIVYLESTCESLLERLNILEDVIINKKVDLIILDSVASLARKEFGHQAVLTDRNEMLMRQAAKLKYYAETFNIPVLVTNQISTQVSDSEFGNVSCVTAALGNTWAHAVNSRLMVTFVNDRVRQMVVAKSPIAPPASFCYKIDEGGIVFLSQA
ncbi:DNA repair protein RAD51 homolog 2-like isoform X1 [Hydractinia symbiolongicarpus]|uniref:DNA repair protein RAD51 homolog 2-like isoform X1 n=1 Tax=Hydractinia symbiolongicarpus TaxID=13093 RepID=UPI00254BDF27|nr:DNA repair protein RAD51 homolog 2-like isoform X1 [Hydractinia symbiolongicarpus]